MSSKIIYPHNSSRKRPIAYCPECGKPIYQTDKNGEPYRLCYSCSRTTKF